MRQRLVILSVMFLGHTALGLYQISGELWDNSGYLNFRTPEGAYCPVNVNNQGSVWTHCPNVNLSGVNWTSLIEQIRGYYKTHLNRFANHQLYQGLKLIAEGGSSSTESGAPNSPPPSDQGTPISKEDQYQGFTSKNRQLHYDGKPLFFSKKEHNLVFADGKPIPEDKALAIAKYYDTEFEKFPVEAQQQINNFKRSAQYKKYEEKKRLPPAPSEPEESEEELPPPKPTEEKPQEEKSETPKPEGAQESKFCSDPMNAVCASYFKSANPDEVKEAKQAEESARSKLRNVAGKPITRSGMTTLAFLQTLENVAEKAQKRVDEIDQQKKATPAETVSNEEEKKAKDALTSAQREFIQAYDTYIKSLAKHFDADSVKKTVEYYKGQLGALVDRDINGKDVITKYNNTAAGRLKESLRREITYRPYHELISEYAQEALTNPSSENLVARSYGKLKDKIKSCSIDALAVNAYISEDLLGHTLTICPGYLLSVSDYARSAEEISDSALVKLPANAAGCGLVFPHEIGHGLDRSWLGETSKGNGLQSGDPTWLNCLTKTFNQESCPVFRRNMVDKIPGPDPVRMMSKEILADIYGANSVALELEKIQAPEERLAFLGKAYGLFCESWEGIPGSKRTEPARPTPRGVGPPQEDPQEETIPNRPMYGTPSVAIAVGSELKHQTGPSDRFTDTGEKNEPVVTHPKPDARIGVILGLNPRVRAAMKCDKDVPQCDPTKYNTSGSLVDFVKDTRTNQPAYCDLPANFYDLKEKQP